MRYYTITHLGGPLHTMTTLWTRRPPDTITVSVDYRPLTYEFVTGKAFEGTYRLGGAG